MLTGADIARVMDAVTPTRSDSPELVAMKVAFGFLLPANPMDWRSDWAVKYLSTAIPVMAGNQHYSYCYKCGSPIGVGHEIPTKGVDPLVMCPRCADEAGFHTAEAEYNDVAADEASESDTY
jgi:hypothetical protein